MPAESLAERGANTAFSAGGGALGQAGGNARQTLQLLVRQTRLPKLQNKKVKMQRDLTLQLLKRRICSSS